MWFDYESAEEENEVEKEKKMFPVGVEICIVPQDDDILLGNVTLQLERTRASFGIVLSLKEGTCELLARGNVIRSVSRKDSPKKRMGWLWKIFPTIWNNVHNQKPLRVGMPISFSFEIEIGAGTNVHLHKLASEIK